MAKKQVGLKLDEGLLARLDVYTQEHNQSRTAVVERALDMVLGGGAVRAERLEVVPEPEARELVVESTPAFVVKPGSMLSKMGVKEPSEKKGEERAKVMCQDKGCRMKIPHGAH